MTDDVYRPQPAPPLTPATLLVRNLALVAALLALPIFLVTGWGLGSWALAAGLWVVNCVVSVAVARFLIGLPQTVAVGVAGAHGAAQQVTPDRRCERRDHEAQREPQERHLVPEEQPEHGRSADRAHDDLPAAREPDLQDGVDHARTRSPCGSKSGSAATSPAIHSPKISTSTGRPGSACAAGRYAYAIDRATE